MKLVILESPYSAKSGTGNLGRNIEYARLCVRDSVLRGEAPIASHLLFTQPGVLNDKIPEERRLGMSAGHAWCVVADLMAAYVDHGTSAGMHNGIDKALKVGLSVEYRRIL